VAAGGMAGAMMAKGPPGAFPVLFLLLVAFVGAPLGGRRLPWAFVRSGAPLTFALLAGPWYGFVYASGNLHRLLYEVDVIVTGEGHGKAFYYYVPMLLEALLPWTATIVLALVAASGRAWRGDVRLRILLAWVVSKLRGALPAVVCGAIATALIIAAGETFWLSDVSKDEARAAAQYIHENVGPGPFCYYGANLSLALCFDLRETIPFYDTPEKL